MLDPSIETGLRLLSGGWWGLAFGIFEGWSHTLWAAAFVFGVLVAGISVWLRPGSPHGFEERWEKLPVRQRRAIYRAVARGQRVRGGAPPHLTAEVAEFVAGGGEGEDPGLLSRVAGLLFLDGVVVFAATQGAPPGWVAVGAAYPIAVTVAAAYEASAAASARARRAAALNG